MRNATMFHGGMETPDSFWYPSIKMFLEGQGYQVWAPLLPNPDFPELRIQLPYVLENGRFDEETILVAHSAGCPLLLSVLENIDVKIAKAILVAGMARKLGDYPNPIVQEKYNWERIKANFKEIYFIHSDNDPWGCGDKEGYYMFENLGGTLIIRHGEGHMGSKTFNQPYREFPLLEKLLMS